MYIDDMDDPIKAFFTENFLECHIYHFEFHIYHIEFHICYTEFHKY